MSLHRRTVLRLSALGLAAASGCTLGFGGTSDEVDLLLENGDDTAHRLSVTVSFDGSVLAEETVSLSAGGSARATFENPESTSDAVVTAELDDAGRTQTAVGVGPGTGIRDVYVEVGEDGGCQCTPAAPDPGRRGFIPSRGQPPSGMKQSQLRPLGVLDLFLVAGLAVVFGPGVLSTPPVVFVGVAGVGATLAGTVSALSLGPVTLGWRHLAELSFGTFALVVPATYAPAVVAGTASGSALFLFAVTTVGGVSLAFYGVDAARGGRHFDVEQDVERTVGR
jgi:microcompartment protein CcmK/EutM